MSVARFFVIRRYRAIRLDTRLARLSDLHRLRRRGTVCDWRPTCHRVRFCTWKRRCRGPVPAIAARRGPPNPSRRPKLSVGDRHDHHLPGPRAVVLFTALRESGRSAVQKDRQAPVDHQHVVQPLRSQRQVSTASGAIGTYTFVMRRSRGRLTPSPPVRVDVLQTRYNWYKPVHSGCNPSRATDFVVLTRVKRILPCRTFVRLLVIVWVGYGRRLGSTKFFYLCVCIHIMTIDSTNCFDSP